MIGRRFGVGIAAIAALAFGGFAVAVSPSDEGTLDPLYLTGGVGDQIEARVLSALVTDVTLAERLVLTDDADAPDRTTDGVWVVVSAELTSNLGYVGVGSSELVIGEVHYRVAQIDSAALSLPYGAGVRQAQTLAFELPLAALDAPGASRASILLLPQLDARLDTVPLVVVDLTTLETEPSARFEQPRVVERP